MVPLLKELFGTLFGFPVAAVRICFTAEAVPIEDDCTKVIQVGFDGTREYYIQRVNPFIGSVLLLAEFERDLLSVLTDRQLVFRVPISSEASSIFSFTKQLEPRTINSAYQAMWAYYFAKRQKFLRPWEELEEELVTWIAQGLGVSPQGLSTLNAKQRARLLLAKDEHHSRQ